jgi:hypothetical protein
MSAEELRRRRSGDRLRGKIDQLIISALSDLGSLNRRHAAQLSVRAHSRLRATITYHRFIVAVHLRR